VELSSSRRDPHAEQKLASAPAARPHLGQVGMERV
jgi:hypothetical protein